MDIKGWLKRWQEPVVWMPLLALLAFGAWLVFGAMDPASTVDMLSRLMDLPITTAYAVAVLGLAWFARRRQRRRLSDEEQRELWRRTLDGELGALLIYFVDTFVWLVCVYLLLQFFSR